MRECCEHWVRQPSAAAPQRSRPNGSDHASVQPSTVASARGERSSLRTIEHLAIAGGAVRVPIATRKCEHGDDDRGQHRPERHRARDRRDDTRSASASSGTASARRRHRPSTAARPLDGARQEPPDRIADFAGANELPSSQRRGRPPRRGEIFPPAAANPARQAPTVQANATDEPMIATSNQCVRVAEHGEG